MRWFRGQTWSREAAVVVAVLGAGLLTSLISPFPAQGNLPVPALGFPLLLHVERAVALVGLLAVAALVVSRAARGELPIRFANLEYESQQLTQLANHERRIERLEEAHSFRPKSGLENGDDGL
jgi:hypothetical protein